MDAKRLATWIAILKECKKLYKLGMDDGYLCHACVYAAKAYYIPASSPLVTDLTNWIQGHLYPWISAEGWLAGCYDLDLSYEEMKQWRIQWIDILIQELKA